MRGGWRLAEKLDLDTLAWPTHKRPELKVWHHAAKKPSAAGAHDRGQGDSELSGQSEADGGMVGLLGAVAGRQQRSYTHLSQPLKTHTLPTQTWNHNTSNI